MRIGIVTTWFERGAAYVSRNYYQTLSQKNDVFIYARGENYAIGDKQWDQPYVTWAKPGKLPMPHYIDWKDFNTWIKKNHIEVIFFNEQQNWDVILKCIKSKYIIGSYIDYYKEETIPFFSLFDFLICNTKRHYSAFKDYPQVFYIPWGTDCNIFKPTKKKKLDGTISFFHSAGMGGVNLRKGTDLAVIAFNKISSPDARLIIHSQVGIDRFNEVKGLINSDPRIKFIEKTVSAPGLYFKGDVYIYPTRLEGIGLTIAEALASGMPVITTNDAPMNEFVIEGETGYLVDVSQRIPRDDGYYWPQSICSIESLVSGMQYYIDNPNEISRQGKNARKWALKNLNWANNSDLLQKVFSSVHHIEKPFEIHNKLIKYNHEKIMGVKKRMFKRSVRKYLKMN